jgi:hypothetical protein
MFKYPNVSNKMSGPVFIYHNEVLVLVLWLKFVPKKMLEKNMGGQ